MRRSLACHPERSEGSPLVVIIVLPNRQPTRLSGILIRRTAPTREERDVKALVKTASGAGNLEIRDIPEPVAGPGQVVIEVVATGICGTDIHIQRGEYNCVPPVVLGHELVGKVADIGADVTGLSVGDRVITETYFRTCGHCRACLAGQLNLCPERRSIGTHVNGG